MNNQLDNLQISSVRQGAVDFFGNVFLDLYNTYQGNANSVAFLNVVNMFNDIVHLDNLRTLNLESTDTLKYQSKDAINKKQGTFVDLTTIQSATGVIPNNINSANGIFIKSFEPIIYEKNFNANINLSNSKIITNLINSTLNTNGTYANNAVSTSVEYAIDNGYITNLTGVTSGSFNFSASTLDMQNNLELADTFAKSDFLHNNFLS